jgi:hypothetical protein
VPGVSHGQVGPTCGRAWTGALDLGDALVELGLPGPQRGHLVRSEDVAMACGPAWAEPGSHDVAQIPYPCWRVVLCRRARWWGDRRCGRAGLLLEQCKVALIQGWGGNGSSERADDDSAALLVRGCNLRRLQT